MSRRAHDHRLSRVGGSFNSSDGIVGSNVIHVLPTGASHSFSTAQRLERCERGMHHVVLVAGANALGEHVVYAGCLEHCAHRATRDNASTWSGWLEQNPTRAVVTKDIVRDGAPYHGNLKQVLAG